MQSMEKGFHHKSLEYARGKTRWVLVFLSGYEVKKPGGFCLGWVGIFKRWSHVGAENTILIFNTGGFAPSPLKNTGIYDHTGTCD